MPVNIQTIKDIRVYLAVELAGLYPLPEINAISNIIIKTVINARGLQAFSLPETRVSGKQAKKVEVICRELKRGKPIQYVLGETDFYNCTIRLDSSTLIPRPETEELVDLIIKENRGFTGSVLDIGTGSGCIAVSLAVNLPGAKITGIDNSAQALEIAKANASLNKVKVNLLLLDIMDPEVSDILKTDIIVSNPPYVRESEKKLMAGNVVDFEPHQAIFVPDSDPLKYYIAILESAKVILTSGGKVYFEINEAFGPEMEKLLYKYNYTSVTVKRDLNDRDRIVKAIKNG